MSLLDTIRSGYDIEDRVLQNLGLRPYPMYIRTITTTGAQEELGVKGTETNSDLTVTPTPRVKNVSLKMVAQSNGYWQVGDIIAFISANIPKATLEAADFFVYQDELWKLVGIDAEEDISTPFQWMVTLRRHDA